MIAHHYKSRSRPICSPPLPAGLLFLGLEFSRQYVGGIAQRIDQVAGILKNSRARKNGPEQLIRRARDRYRMAETLLRLGEPALQASRARPHRADAPSCYQLLSGIKGKLMVISLGGSGLLAVAERTRNFSTKFTLSVWLAG